MLREKARAIAARLPLPDFYAVHAGEVSSAQSGLANHPLLNRLMSLVAERIENDFGHGLAHARKVAVDAGALMLVESQQVGLSEVEADRRQILAQSAGQFIVLLQVKQFVGYLPVGRVSLDNKLQVIIIRQTGKRERSLPVFPAFFVNRNINCLSGFEVQPPGFASPDLKHVTCNMSYR